MKIETKISLHATPEKVWKVLTDFKAYPEWNTYMTSVSGTLQVGKKLRVQMQLTEGHAFKARPKLLIVDKGKELRWMARLYFSGVYDNERYFLIRRESATKVTFIQGETYGGFMAKRLFEQFGKPTEAAMRNMNKELKKYLR